jgi:hypothetical protein
MTPSLLGRLWPRLTPPDPPTAPRSLSSEPLLPVDRSSSGRGTRTCLSRQRGAGGDARVVLSGPTSRGTLVVSSHGG